MNYVPGVTRDEATLTWMSLLGSSGEPPANKPVNVLGLSVAALPLAPAGYRRYVSQTVADDMTLREAHAADSAFLLSLAREAYGEVLSLQFAGWNEAVHGLANSPMNQSAFLPHQPSPGCPCK